MKKFIVKEEVVQALNSNEYVTSVHVSEVSFINTTLLIETSESGTASRSNKESDFAVAKFTAQCGLSPNSSSVDVKSLITESFSQFLNTTVHLEMEGIIYISEAYKQKFQKHFKIMNDERFMAPPNATEFERIMTDENKSYCRNENQWTPWYSTDNATNGSDFEILTNHVNIYRFFEILKLDFDKYKSSIIIISVFSVCSNPTHVDAREKLSKYSWTGSKAHLIFDNTPKFGDTPNETRSWSWGISRKFG